MIKGLHALFSFFFFAIKRLHKQKRLQKSMHTAQPSKPNAESTLEPVCRLPIPAFSCTCLSATSVHEQARPRARASTCNGWAYTHGFQFFQAPRFYEQNILGTIRAAKRGEHGTCDKDWKIGR